tara:strand:+ start:175 stop:693 length:519 start_codon:yes stop_codon:yes gene_type:complete
MKKIATLLLTLLVSGSVWSLDAFALKCENGDKTHHIKELYFFYKIKRFTGYYSIKENATLTISGIQVPYTSELNKCRYDGEERNRIIFDCKSEYSGGWEKPETGIGIDRGSLAMLRSYTTTKYNFEGLSIFGCLKLSKEEYLSKLESFKAEKKELNKRIKEAKKSVKNKNKI